MWGGGWVPVLGPPSWSLCDLAPEWGNVWGSWGLVVYGPVVWSVVNEQFGVSGDVGGGDEVDRVAIFLEFAIGFVGRVGGGVREGHVGGGGEGVCGVVTELCHAKARSWVAEAVNC